MGKYNRKYARVDRDHYPTPPWVVSALAEHVNLAGARIWECACGDGRMVEALYAAGARFVLATDIVDLGYPRFGEVFDFLSHGRPKTTVDGSVTNPPFGYHGTLAEKFIEVWLQHPERGGFLALLLPADFDSAKTRVHLFRDCPHFIGKIVLTRRVVWFNRTDGGREDPMGNSAWFLWQRAGIGPRIRTLHYAPSKEEGAAI